MNQRFEKIISGVFHPVLIPSYMLLVMMNQSYYYVYILTLKGKFILFGISFLFTAFFPLAMIFILLKKKWIASLTMHSREERIYPLFITSILYFSTYYLFRQSSVFPVFEVFLLGSIMLITIALLTNFFWKISIHCLALGGVVGTFIGLSARYNIANMYQIIITILLSGIVAYSRLALREHSSLQVYTGFTTGAVVMFLLFFML
ncbi:MAG: hypothetical protein M0R21_05150 [Lentimicrobiaceae bacterium]|jgi:hypothetical protein|nr:hypothetical protein [Lentimicrobiaceae bacterium]